MGFFFGPEAGMSKLFSSRSPGEGTAAVASVWSGAPVRYSDDDAAHEEGVEEDRGGNNCRCCCCCCGWRAAAAAVAKEETRYPEAEEEEEEVGVPEEERESGRRCSPPVVNTLSARPFPRRSIKGKGSGRGYGGGGVLLLCVLIRDTSTVCYGATRAVFIDARSGCGVERPSKDTVIIGKLDVGVPS